MATMLAQVKSAMLAKAQGSGLKPSDVTKLRLTPYTADQLAAVIPPGPKGLPQYLAAFTIPYFDLRGTMTKFLRVRYVEEPTGFAAMTGKALRYAQPKGSVNEVYLPPFADWADIAKNLDHSVLITEGELKAACATKMGMPCIGLGGVTMFSDRKAGHFVLPGLKQFKWDLRRAFILFDSDAATNPNVLRAEAMLCRELTKLGAVPIVVRIPKLTEDGKTGLDDFLMAEGEDGLMKLIEESKPYSLSAALHGLNEEVIYVMGSDIVYAPKDDLRMRTDKFCTSHYANRKLLVPTEKGMVEKGAALEWMKWERRSEVMAFTYRPGDLQFTEDRKLNLWEPWPQMPAKGDVTMWHKVMDHIFMDSEPKARAWFEKWCAYPLQHPGAKLKTAVMMWGGQGVGKSFVGETIMRLYGPHNSTKFGNAQLSASFNGWAEHKQFAVGEEIVIHSNEKKAIAELLKTLITDTTISIRRLYLNAYDMPNCMNIFLVSNHANALKLEEDDRRFFVHHVKSPKMPPELYRPFDKWSHSTEGLAALFHYFLSVDLTGFDPQAAAMHTNDRYNMISGGRSEHGAWVAELREAPENVLVLGKAPVKYSLFSLEDLLVLFKARHERSQVTTTTLGNELAMQGFKRAYPGVIRTQQGSKRLWVIRPDDRFKLMGPSQFGEWYDHERGRELKQKTPSTKSKGAKY